MRNPIVDWSDILFDSFYSINLSVLRKNPLEDDVQNREHT